MKIDEIIKTLPVIKSNNFTAEMYLAGIKCYKLKYYNIHLAQWDFRRNKPLDMIDCYCALLLFKGRYTFVILSNILDSDTALKYIMEQYKKLKKGYYYAQKDKRL